MEEKDDASYIRIPTAVAYALVGALGIGGTGVVGYVRQSPDQNELAKFEKDLQSLREEYRSVISDHRGFFRDQAKYEESIRAWMEVANANSGRITANRELIYEKTTGRFTSIDHEKYEREQSSRDQDQNRRLETLERQVDNLVNAYGK